MARQGIVSALHRRVMAALEEGGLTSGKTLVVAVSGGPDSLALLHSLHNLKDTVGLQLHGAHLNHGLRAQASREDAKFVTETFRHLDIPHSIVEADVSSYREAHSLSLEEAAREVRYAFLARVAAGQHADAIALGHTADDQAETVLMHIIRGSGLTGLRGMDTVAHRVIGGKRAILLRPMLSVARRETAAYCDALGLTPRHDESNLSLEPTRNRVRMELLPMLQTYNPSVGDALVRLSRSASQDVAYLEQEVERVWPGTVRRADCGVVLSRSALGRLAPTLRRHLLRRAVSEVKGDLDDLQWSHIEDMVRLIAGPSGRSLDLPGGVRFHTTYGEATLVARGSDVCPLPPLDGEHALQAEGQTLLPGWRVTAAPVRGASGPEASGLHYKAPRRPAIETANIDNGTPPSAYAACLDGESVAGPLWVRTRRPGDRFQPLGMAVAKKLQDFMVDDKIPREWRDRVPLVVSPKGIAWVVGWRIADWARVKNTGGRRIELRFSNVG